MDQIIAQIGDTIAQFFGSPIVQFALQAAGVYLVIIWLASAYWAFRDMQQRSANVLLPYLAAAGIILFTPVFFIFAVWIYKIIRPHDKIGEVYERNLAEEALLNEVESIHHCPGCEHRIDDDWIICPYCRTRLNRVCPNCSRLVGMDWSLCAWCGKDFERRQVPAAAVQALPGGREATARITSQAHVPAAGSGGGGGAAASNASVVRPSVMPASGTLPTSGGDPLPER